MTTPRTSQYGALLNQFWLRFVLIFVLTTAFSGAVFGQITSVSITASKTGICPVADFIQLTAFSPDAVSYKWNTGPTGPNLTVGNFSSNTTFTVTATDALGNTAQASYTVQVLVCPAFTAPDTVCVGEPITIQNATTNAASHYWNFCSGNLTQTPTATNLGNLGALNTPVYMAIAKDGANYYTFTTNFGNGTISRQSYGNSLLNTPVSTNLGNLGGVIPANPEGIQVYFDNGVWTGYLVAGGGNAAIAALIRLDFGTSLANTPTAVNLGNIGNLNFPHDLYITKDGTNWVGFVVNKSSASFTRFDFGPNLASVPTGTNIPIAAFNLPTGVYFVKTGLNWSAFVTNSTGSKLVRLDFGQNLQSVPTATDLGNPGNTLNTPFDLTLLQDCNQTVGFVTSQTNSSIIRLTFPNGITAAPSAVSLGNGGGAINQPHGISNVFRVQDTLFFFVTNSGANTIARYAFPSCTGIASVSSSTALNPPTFSYNTPGTYNVNYIANEGLVDQGSLCKTIVVTAPPTITVVPSSAGICIGGSATLTANGAVSYVWTPSTGLNSTTATTVTANPQNTTTYTVTGTDAQGCTATTTVTVTVFQPPVANAGADRTICPNASTIIGTAGVNGVSYQWIPNTGLDNDEIAQPTATLAASRTYTVVATQPAGPNLIANPGFEQGNTGFTSSYTFNAVAPSATMEYSIMTTPQWAPCVDHTTGTGLMFVADPAKPPGVADPSKSLWCQTVAVTPNTNYQVGYYGASANINPPRLQMKINGVPLDTSIMNLGASCVWAQQFAIWNSGAATTASLCIFDLLNTAEGNDVVLDDIFMTPICVDSDVVVVTVAKPTVAISPASLTLCSGKNHDLTASGAITYAWAPATGLSATSGATVTASPTVSTVYTVTGTDANGCTDTETVSVTVNALPSVAASASASSICPNGSSSLTASGATSYAWSNGASGATISVTPAQTSTFTVTGTDGNGCTATATVTVTVLTPPTVAATAAQSTICTGMSVSLTASGATSYVWSNGSNGATISVTPVQTSTFTVTGTDANGCTATGTVTVTVQNPPTADAGQDVTICPGGTAQLGTTGVAGVVYDWTPAATLSDPNIANPTATPAATTTYTLTASQATGTNLVVNGDFSAGNTGFNSSYINSNNLVPEGRYAVVTSPNIVHAGFQACPDHSTGSGNMMVVNGAGTPNTSVWCQTVNVIPGNLYQFSAFASNVSAGVQARLQFSINGVLLGSVFTVPATTCVWDQFFSYWSSGAATTAQICIVNQNTATGGNDFALDDISLTPVCQSVDQVTVTVASIPTVTASASPAAICVGGSTTLTGSGATTYTWMPGNLSGTTVSVSPTQTTTYTVTGSSGIGCSGTGTVTVTVNTIPTVLVSADIDSICTDAGTDVTLTATGATTYTWAPGIAQTTASVTLSPTQTTTYTVTGTRNGCTNTATITITVLPPPPISVTADATTICRGSCTNLHGAGGTTFSWSTGAVGANIQVCPTQTSTFTLLGFDNFQCFNTTTITITVIPSPTVTVGASPSEICAGETTTLTASPNNLTAYAWSPAVIGTGASVTVRPLVNTTYTVVGTAANGCTASQTVLVTVNPKPVVTASANNPTICAGSPVTLTAQGAGIVDFDWGNGLNGVSINVNPLVTTTYSVIGTDAFGCKDTANVTVTVNPLPNLSFNAPTQICNGNSATMTVSGAVSYIWQPTNKTTATVTESPTISTTYTVTGTDANGCVNTATYNLIVSNQPPVAANADFPAVCIGDSATLFAFGANTYTWSPNTTTPATGSQVKVAPNQTTTYTVTGTDAGGCSATATVTVGINPLPTITASASPTAICSGESTTLTANGGVTYDWGVVLGSGNNLQVSPTQTTTFTVTGTDGNGCVNTATVTITVNPLPTINVSAQNPTICRGQSTNLTATGGLVYDWGAVSPSDLATISVSPTTTTTFTVTGFNQFGCENTATVTVTVNQLPTIGITGAAPICVGDSIQITGTGGQSYVWSTGQTTASIFVRPAVTTTFTVTGTDANGCANTATVSITVNQRPTITASAASAAICVGQSTTITAQGGVSYTWSNSLGVGASKTVNPAVTTTFTVTGTNASGCTSTATVTVTVNPLPTITLSTQTPTICRGPSATLTANGGVTYNWGAASPLTSASISVSPINTTTFTVTGTDANGCQNTGTVTVTVNPLPNIGINGANAICAGDSTQLTGTGGVSYVWSTGQTSTSVFVRPAVTSTFTVTGTDANGCQNTATHTVVVNPLPNIVLTADDAILCPGQSVTITANGATNYAWSDGLGVGSVKTFIPAVTHTYTVTGTDANGCSNTQTITIEVQPPTPITFAGDSILCFGESTTITALGSVSYVWNTGITSANLTITPAVTTTFTVTGTNANGCTETATITVVVNPLPTVTIGGAQAFVCVGQPFNLIANGALTYVWNNGSTNQIFNTSQVSLTTYSVVGTDVNGCTNSAEVTIDVISMMVNAGANSSFLPANNAVQLGGTPSVVGGTGPYTYQWSPATYLSCANCPNPVAHPDTTVTYILTVTDANGCTATDDVSITKISLPPQPLICNAQATVTDAICYGSSVMLLGDGIGGVYPYTYQWSPTIGLADSMDKNTLASPTVTTVYTLTIYDAVGAIATDVAQVTVNPRMFVDAGADQHICNGSSAQIGGQPTANMGGLPYAYQWSPTIGLNNANSANPIASPSVSTHYVVTVTDSFGCKMSDTVWVEVLSFPAVTAFAGADGVICNNSSFILSASANGGNGVYTYNWSPIASLTNPTSANPTANPAQTTVYTVIVSDGNGCFAVDTQKVSVSPALSAGAPATHTICGGSPVTLSVNPQGGTQPYSYDWSPAFSLNANNLPNPIASPTQATIYTATVTDALGCKAVTLITVNVLPALIVNAGADITNCGVASGQLNGSAFGGSGQKLYSWTPATGLSNPFILNPIVTATSTKTYTLTVTDANGCTATDAVTYVTGAAISVQLQPKVSFCGGANGVTLAPTVTGGLGVYTFAWSPASGLNDSTLKNPTANPTVSTVYTLTVSDANGCTATAQIEADPLYYSGATAELSAKGLTHLCPDDTLILTAEPANLTAYQWLRDGVTLVGETKSTLNVTQAGFYQVILVDGRGCAGGASDTLTVTSFALSAAPVVSFDGTNLQASPVVSGVSYQWLRNGQPVAGADSSAYRPTEAGFYQVEVSDSFGCAARSEILVVNSTGLSDLAETFSFSVYPNPNNGAFTLAFTNLTAPLALRLTDVLGQTILSETVSPNADGRHAVSLANPARGVYLLELSDGNGGKWVEKVVVSK